MGIINVDDIRGYHFEDEIVCADCATVGDRKDIEEDQILIESDLEGDDEYFCDRCKGRMN